MKRRAARHVAPRPTPAAPLVAAPHPADPSGRRHFLQLLAGASAAPWARLALPALGLAGAATAAAQTSDEAPPPPEVEPWLAIVRQRYGERLSPEQLQAVAENLSWTARSGKTLRSAALTNADEPDVVFRAEPPEGS